jgi:hypothetical protein
LESKIRALFVGLLGRATEQQDESAVELLARCYSLSKEQHKLVEDFEEQVGRTAIDWTWGWPGNLLVGLFDKMSLVVEREEEIDWTITVDMILGLPEWEELGIAAEVEAAFKKCKHSAIQLSRSCCLPF